MHIRHHRRSSRLLTVLVMLTLVCLPLVGMPNPAFAVAGPALSVNATALRHAISPYIYGMNYTGEALAQELHLPVRRWGGNSTTRYNYQFDMSNHASDWYFENIYEGIAPNPSLPNGSTADLFVEQDRRTVTKTLMTVPLIGWTPTNVDRACGFSIAKYGAQQDADIWVPDCGNGKHTDGSFIVGNDPLDTSIAIGPAFVQGWMNHLIGNYGTAANGGVLFYNLDNEPDLWHETHRDVHPVGASYDEMRDQTYAIGAAVKATDPGAQTIGPAGFSYISLKFSGKDLQTCNQVGGACWSNPPDAGAHGGTPFGTWYLQQMAAYQTAHGVRILDYFDNHLYPQGLNVDTEVTDPTTNALRLRSTRSLWDPTYVDESWIGEAMYYIPRVKTLIAANYPGTKTAITEYRWGAFGDINGALAEADVLGIFGREGLDMAALWGGPLASQPVTYAFRMYRNYDGAGHMFGDTSVQSTSGDQGQLAIYGAQRASDGALTLMIINKTANPLTSNLTLSNFVPASNAQVYTYSTANLNAIVQQPVQAVGPGGFSATYAANSITLVVIPRLPAGIKETVGIFRKSLNTFFLRNSNTTGSADITHIFGASPTTDWPVVGDWDGDGVKTVGVYNSSTGQFLLKNSNTSGSPIVYSPVLGSPGDRPMSGDWTGSGRDGIGVFRPSNGLIYIKNDPTASGFADFTMVLGSPGDVPVAGDWDSNGKDSPGVYRPSLPRFFLTNQVCTCGVFADYSPTLGISGDTPFTGDWTGSSRSGIGVFRPSNGLIYLKNDPTADGFADINIVFGVPNDLPVAGHWIAGPVSIVNPAGSNVPPAPTFIPIKK
jgi:Glycoside hydrolase family 44